MTEFKFACPVCGQHITSDSSASGTQIECPTCFQKIVVPQAPTDQSSRFILSATQAPGKRPLSEIGDVSTVAPQRPRWRQLLWASLGGVIIAGTALAWLKWGKIILQPAGSGAATDTRSNITEHIDRRLIALDTRWRRNLGGVQIPTNTAAGRVWNRPFQVQRATLDNGVLELFQGPNWPPDLGVTVFLPQKPAQDFAGKQFLIPMDYSHKAPRVVLRTKDSQQKAATTGFRTGYALKLEFDQIINDKLPGRIYLCMPDKEKSVVVGGFSAEILK